MTTLSEFYESTPEKPYARRIHEANPNVLRSFRKHMIQGRAPSKGSFVWACLANDLSLAVGKADDEMSERIEDVVLYLNNCLPMGCWGSEDAIRNWSNDGGLAGSIGRSDAIRVAEDTGM